MINGLPGDMAECVVQNAHQDKRFEVIPYSLTGPEIEFNEVRVGEQNIILIKPDQSDAMIAEIKLKHNFISIDYTHPSAVNSNCGFYCKHNLAFVMGTTGGDRQHLKTSVENSSINAVIAPNMAKQIVGFQAMLAWAGEQFPGLFDGYHLEIKESHQKNKVDTSGTALATLPYFNNLGLKCSSDDIKKERSPEIQKNMGIPNNYLNGHAWHTYNISSIDDSVKFKFVHNVNGRTIYAKGTLDAAAFLASRSKSQGQVYTMPDVIRN